MKIEHIGGSIVKITTADKETKLDLTFLKNRITRLSKQIEFGEKHLEALKKKHESAVSLLQTIYDNLKEGI